MKKDDIEFDQRRTLGSLLSLVKSELTAPSSEVTTLALLHRVLDLSDYGTIFSDLNDLDAEILLDFIIHLVRKGTVGAYWGTQDIRQKARRLMFELISEKDVLPKSLFITGVRINPNVIGVGVFGDVFNGEYEGQRVAVKALYQQDSVRKDIRREALTWRSLSHRYILPFLGVFEENSQLFLVSPYMENGTLSTWRNRNQPAVVDIHRRMLEVAEAMEYIHAEGLIHGDLKGGNVLLDHHFRCQITDFGSTRPSDPTVSKSDISWSLNIAAPELLNICDECSDADCDGCRERVQKKTTIQTDVYAFGCLYYVILFDYAPFRGKSKFQIIEFIMSGNRPPRMESPTIDDNVWNLIEHCWNQLPSKRPTMQEVVETMKAWAAHD